MRFVSEAAPSARLAQLLSGNGSSANPSIDQRSSGWRVGAKLPLRIGATALVVAHGLFASLTALPAGSQTPALGPPPSEGSPISQVVYILGRVIM